MTKPLSAREKLKRARQRQRERDAARSKAEAKEARSKRERAKVIVPYRKPGAPAKPARKIVPYKPRKPLPSNLLPEGQERQDPEPKPRKPRTPVVLVDHGVSMPVVVEPIAVQEEEETVIITVQEPSPGPAPVLYPRRSAEAQALCDWLVASGWNVYQDSEGSFDAITDDIACYGNALPIPMTGLPNRGAEGAKFSGRLRIMKPNNGTPFEDSDGKESFGRYNGAGATNANEYATASTYWHQDPTDLKLTMHIVWENKKFLAQGWELYAYQLICRYNVNEDASWKRTSIREGFI